jgi:hypothetical protein
MLNPPESQFFQFEKIFQNLARQIPEYIREPQKQTSKTTKGRKYMKTITKIIYTAVCVLTLAMGALTAYGWSRS